MNTTAATKPARLTNPTKIPAAVKAQLSKPVASKLQKITTQRVRGGAVTFDAAIHNAQITLWLTSYAVYTNAADFKLQDHTEALAMNK